MAFKGPVRDEARRRWWLVMRGCDADATMQAVARPDDKTAVGADWATVEVVRASVRGVDGTREHLPRWTRTRRPMSVSAACCRLRHQHRGGARHGTAKYYDDASPALHVWVFYPVTVTCMLLCPGVLASWRPAGLAEPDAGTSDMPSCASSALSQHLASCS